MTPKDGTLRVETRVLRARPGVSQLALPWYNHDGSLESPYFGKGTSIPGGFEPFEGTEGSGSQPTESIEYSVNTISVEIPDFPYRKPVLIRGNLRVLEEFFFRENETSGLDIHGFVRCPKFSEPRYVKNPPFGAKEEQWI
eukprot:scaffold2678_cov356-Pavlova_lutheri.AAC.8